MESDGGRGVKKAVDLSKLIRSQWMKDHQS
jgi:DNA-binding protein